MNRLNKWAVLAVKLAPLGGALQAMTDSWSTTLEMDVNTAADRREPLPEDRLLDVLAELSSHAQAIAAEGDRA